MSANLQVVKEKGMADAAFAKELFIDPKNACKAAGIKLNPTELKILDNAMTEARKYYAERLYLITQPADVLSNGNCAWCG